MPDPTCSHDGCDSPVEKRQAAALCESHYRAGLRAEKGPCEVDGCETAQQTRGLCLKHYHRMRRYGTTDDHDRTPPPLGACSVDGCDGTPKSRGLCGKHYAADQRSKYGTCTVEDCENGATNRRGWCAAHYARVLNHGTPDAPPPRRKMSLICTVDDCDMPVRARSLCPMHYKRLMSYGSTDAAPPTRTKTCTNCGATKPRPEFEPNESVCTQCMPTVRRQRNANRLSRSSGVQVSVAGLFAKQCGCCAICGRHASEFERGLHTDHDHKTGAVRALLCPNCNVGIGHFRDNPSLLGRAARYLREHDKAYRQLPLI